MSEPSLPNDQATPSPEALASGAIDAGAEESLARMTRLAAQGLGMPMAVFSLVDADGHRLQSCFAGAPLPALPPAGWFAEAVGPDGVTLVAPAAVAQLGMRFCAGVPVRGPDGKRAGTLCVLDVRPRAIGDSGRAMLADFAVLLERELAAAALRHQAARQHDKQTATRALFDHLPEGVMMMNEHGVILACNAVAEVMYAATKNGLIGRHSGDFVGEDPGRLRASLQAGKTDQLQAIARRVDGSVFPAEFSVKVLHASGPYRYSLAVRDVSARKAEERKAQAADARRRKYFVTATHELRTPMASVLGFSELLLKHDFDQEERIDIIQVIHRQATRLVRLINEMLDLARIEGGGKEEFDIRAQDPAAMLEQTLSGLDGLHASSRIRTSVAPSLPQVRADSLKLQQALTNILSNAIKYSAADSAIQVDVFETEAASGPMIGFRVTDQGIGMTAEQQARIFEPFYRAHTDQDTAGTGLGMTIFKEIVDLHGGVVRIDSSPGAGTEVLLLLPALAAAH
jgi:PAS domain S-box-containing protein